MADLKDPLMCFVKFIFYLVGIHIFLDFLFASNIPNYQKMAHP